jgi:hypothetical protein
MTKRKEKPEETPEEAPRLVPVRLVAQRGESSLVEWLDAEGLYRRAYVPAALVQQGFVPALDLNRAIPYGIEWEKYIQVTATPQSLANDLRRRGMWTWEDINNAALSAANRAFDVGQFLRQVKAEERKQ